MREHRWETTSPKDFAWILDLGERLARLGLAPVHPSKDIICYIEEWGVTGPDDLDRLDPWYTEDVTFIRIHDGWRGDFFLFAGGYHTVYQRYQGSGTYCSLSHPWSIPAPLCTLHERAMLWVGFRHDRGFIRVRLHTREVIAPGELEADDRWDLWVEERNKAFLAASNMLGLPLTVGVGRGGIMLKATDEEVPLFCSWPDAVGPCQVEYNTPDPYEFLVPASRLAATCGPEHVTARAHFTGFSEAALCEFETAQPGGRSAFRCAAHCPFDELPEILAAVEPDGRVYATLCEFSIQQLRPNDDDAVAVIGVVGAEKGFLVEIRLNRAPLPQDELAGWLQELVGASLRYAPLPPFP